MANLSIMRDKKMKVIRFNGLGLPDDKSVTTGDILIIVTHDSAEVVMLEILPPEDFGPCLTPAKNWKALEKEAFAEVKNNFPECLQSAKHWVFQCPQDIINKAVF